MKPATQLASAVVSTPGRPLFDGGDACIRTDSVYVVYTSGEETLAALRAASGFAKALDIPVTLVHFRTVPYALPVDAPCGISPVETDAFLTRLRAEGLDVRVRVCLCRDARQTIPLAFARPSLIVVAGRRTWWPSVAARWRRMLEAAGHFVMFVDTSEQNARVPQAAKRERVHA